MTPAPRPAAVAGLALVLLGAITVGCTTTVAPTAAPTATPRPGVASPSLEPDVFAGIPPLPEDLILPPGEFLVEPESATGMVLGMPIAYDLGHCGLASPVDLDGSLWEPVGAVDAQGGPIDTDAEVGDLINPTPGEAMLAFPGRLDWRAGRSGVVVAFRRLDGPRRYAGCQ